MGCNIQVLQVASGELSVGDNNDLSLTLLGDVDDLAEVTGAAIDLDLVVEELLERGNVEDLVGSGLRAVRALYARPRRPILAVQTIEGYTHV